MNVGASYTFFAFRADCVIQAGLHAQLQAGPMNVGASHIFFWRSDCVIRAGCTRAAPVAA
jgi:hypothetical protein